MANDIVWADSSETGAPILNNAAGSLVDVLHAFLVTGFRAQTLTSIVVASGVATATLAGHGYSNGRMVDIAGAGTAAINGRKLITVTGSGTFTFPAAGVADGAVGGTITAKRSPAGWSRPFSGGGVAIFARTDPAASVPALRIDDSGAGVASASYARAVAIESYTALDAYTGLSPTAAHLAGGQYWGKGANSAAAKPWVLWADGRTVYLLTDDASYPASSYAGLPSGLYMFGDVATYRPGDAYHCMISGGSSAGSPNANVANPQSLGSPAFATSMRLSRGSAGVGAAVGARVVGMRTDRLGGLGPAWPSPVANDLVISTPLLVTEESLSAGHPFRGVLRGIGDPMGSFTSASAAQAAHLTVLPNVIGSDRRWLLVGYQQTGSYGAIAVDIDGPWA